jgi:hypothetical protein
MKLALVLALGAALACDDTGAGDTSVDSTDAPRDCDPSGIDDLPPGTARIDGCPGDNPDAVAATWASYCVANPGHERCSGPCGDASACPADE